MRERGVLTHATAATSSSKSAVLPKLPMTIEELLRVRQDHARRAERLAKN